MPVITVVFFPDIEEHLNAEEILSYEVTETPKFQVGDLIALMEKNALWRSDSGLFYNHESSATHKIVRASIPLIVYTLDADKTVKTVISTTYNYYLKEMKPKDPSKGVEDISGMFF